MGQVNKNDNFYESIRDNHSRNLLETLRSENRKKRLEKIFNQPGLKIEDLVIAVGDKEVEEEVKRLQEDVKKWDEEINENLTIRELEEEIKNTKKEFDDLVKEIHRLRDENATGIDVERENLRIMLKDITGHNEQLEKDIKDLTEKLESAREEETKLKDELYIAKNEAASASVRQESQSESWSQLRSGKGVGNMAQMMRKK